MRLISIVAVVIALAGLPLTAVTRSHLESGSWAGHPAVAPFGVESSALPSVLYLVRARGELPEAPALTVHARHKDTFLVSASAEALAELKRTGCEAFPLSASAIPEPPRRNWIAIDEADPHIAAMVDAVSWPAIAGLVEWLTDFETRYSFADNHREVVDSIADRFAALGLEPGLHEYTLLGDTLWNVEATHTGTVHPDSYYIICAHFDSYSEDPMNSAPGADDNATGTAAVLTAAEILSQHDFEYSIRFVCFSGEEQFLQGSQRYAMWARQNNLDIVGVMNYDMLGWWQSGVPRDLEIETNVASQWLAEAIINAADLYTDTPYELHVYDGAWWGDHASFWLQGYAAVNHEESWDWFDPDFNPDYHTAGDLPGNLHPGFTTDNVKLTVASLATLAGYIPPLAVTLDVRPGSTPNPFNPRSKGVVPALVLGAADFHVDDIDTATLRLEGVAPVATQVCDQSGDGIADLWMKFRAAEVAAAIGSSTRGASLTLGLTGTLRDGTRFEGDDEVTIVGNAGGPHATRTETSAGHVTALGTAVPNPFNPETRISYTLAAESSVKLTVYDARGRRIARLVDGVRPAGPNQVSWRADGQASGVYFCRLEAGGVVQTRKLILIK